MSSYEKGHSVKEFTNEKNQELWDSWFDNKLKGLPEIEAEKKKASCRQYKPVLLALDGFLNNSFDALIVEKLYKFFDENPKKAERINNLRSVLFYGLKTGLLDLDKEVIINLLPY